MTLPTLIDFPYVPIHSKVYCLIMVYILCTKITARYQTILHIVFWATFYWLQRHLVTHDILYFAWQTVLCVFYFRRFRRHWFVVYFNSCTCFYYSKQTVTRVINTDLTVYICTYTHTYTFISTYIYIYARKHIFHGSRSVSQRQ